MSFDFNDLTNTHYTATEARQKLQLTEDGFQSWIRAGKIHKIIPPGRKHGMFAKRDIDALVVARQAEALKLLAEFQERLVFSASTPGDQMEEMDIGIRCFGSEYITPFPERIAFQQKSEYTFWSLKVDGSVVGYLSTFRFPPAFLNDILTGRKIERETTLNEVYRFKKNEPFDIYIDVMAVDPRLHPHLRSLYAGILASRLAGKILDLIDNGFKIRTLYTVTATPEGDNLVRKLGFRLMVGKSQAAGRIAYEFPLDEKGIEVLRALSHRFGGVFHAHSDRESASDINGEATGGASISA